MEFYKHQLTHSKTDNEINYQKIIYKATDTTEAILLEQQGNYPKEKSWVFKSELAIHQPQVEESGTLTGIHYYSQENNSSKIRRLLMDKLLVVLYAKNKKEQEKKEEQWQKFIKVLYDFVESGETCQY